MIVKMEKLYAFGILQDKDKIIDKIIKKCCIHFIGPEEALDELAFSACMGEPDVSEYRETLERYENVLEEMKPYSGKKSLFYRRPHIHYSRLESAETHEKAEAQCIEAEKLLSSLNALAHAKETAVLLKESLVPWVQSSLPLEIKSTEHLDIAYYILPPDIDKTDLLEVLEANAPASYIEYVRENKEQKYAIVVNHKDHSDITWEIMERFGAFAKHFSGVTEGPPNVNIANTELKLLEYDSQIGEVTNQLKELGQNLYDIKYGCDALALKIRREEINEKIVLTKTAFGFSGWVPEDKKPELEKILNEFNCEYQFTAASKENKDDPPVLFKNDILGQTSEAVVQMYSLPSYYSADPNYVVAPFFSLFFGMMLSDAAYGILLAFGGYFILKKMDLSPNIRGVVKALMAGGVSAVIWGVIFGGWFGDIATVVAKTFFDMHFKMPVIINPLHDPVSVLILSLSLGLLHIMAGMAVKAYLLIIRGKAVSAAFDVGLWYVVFMGIIWVILSGFSSAGMYVIAFGAAGLVLTQGRSKKGIFGKFIGGIASLYDIIRYFSDILSYSRILAMGLSTAVIASVFNTMGSMFGGNVPGALLLLVVFAIGHAFNIIISSFGSYVHTARLQYVEFFGKFFESGGRPFEPFQLIPKYCYVNE